MENKPNLKIFEARREIEGLKDSDNGGYINLRTTDNMALLEEILLQLRSSPNYVIASWVSPPFGIIVGYGVYSKDEAVSLAKRSQRERWGFPRFGSVYEQERLERRIERLKKYSTDNRLAYQL